MVMRQKVCIGFAIDPRSHYVFDLVYPQLLVTSTSAAGMWRAMHTRNIGSLLGGLDVLAAKCETAIEIDETDCFLGRGGATSNMLSY